MFFHGEARPQSGRESFASDGTRKERDFLGRAWLGCPASALASLYIPKEVHYCRKVQCFPPKKAHASMLCDWLLLFGAQHITVAGSGVGQKSFLNSCVGWLTVRKGSLWPHVRVVRSKVSNATSGNKKCRLGEP